MELQLTATAGTQATRESKDLSALDADQWHKTLKLLAGSAADDAAMAHDTVRRSRAGLLSVRDMRLVLLATAHAPSWAPARQAVMAVLAGDLDTTRQVLATHTHAEVWPPPRFEELTTEGCGPGATIAAVVGPAGSQVTGPAQSAPTSREAKDRAALALLARLAGVALPREETPQGRDAERLILPGMPSEVFEQQLSRDVEARQGPGPELEEEALRRAHAGRLRHREMYILLLTARGESWTAVRTAALQRAAAMPPAPAKLLHWHAEHHGAEHGLTYQEDPVDAQGRHHVRAQLRTSTKTTTGPTRASGARKTARHHAACALPAQLAGLPEPPAPVEDKPAQNPPITIPEQGQDPVKHLNKHYQLDTITKPESSVSD